MGTPTLRANKLTAEKGNNPIGDLYCMYDVYQRARVCVGVRTVCCAPLGANRYKTPNKSRKARVAVGLRATDRNEGF